MSILVSFPRCLVFTAWFCVCLLSGAVWSAELGQAKVSAILRDVQKTEGSKTEPAAVGDVIAGGGRITTQGQSLAELKFPDGSVIRIGNNSTFSFDPNDRTVRLDRGTALVSTPPKAEGINIVSGGVSGTVGGDPAGKTFLVTAYSAESGGAKGAPTGGFGLMVLQGSSATTVSAPSGSVSIAPGQFALVGGKMDGAPKVLTVDVGQVFRSSPLVNSFPEPLPTKGAILSTAIQQQGSQSSGGLRSTGTSGVALTSGGDLLTGGSKPAKSGGYTFEIASNVPGTGRQEKQATATEKNKDDSGLDIATAAGGPTGSGGIVGAVTGSTGGGSRAGGGGVNIPSVPSIPANTGQSGITANPNNPNNQNNRNNLPATVVNAQVQSKTYDGLVSAMIQNALLSGIQSGDSVALQNDTTGIFANKNVGTWRVSTTMGLTGADAGRYILTQPTMSGTITAKDVTIATGTAFGKVYDGNTGATVTAGGLSGLVAGEILGISTAVGTFAIKDVGTRNVTAAYTLTDGANLASNYNLINPTETLTATITAKALTMTGSSAASKVYDGNRSASLTLGTLSGEVAGETLGTSTVVGTFNSKDVLSANTVTAVYTLVDGANGELASNYSLANASLASTITAKSLSITAPSIGSKTYDGLATAGSLTLGTLSGFVGSETVRATGTAADFSSANVGSYSSVVTYNLADGLNGGLASNYSLAAGSASGAITAKGLSITAPAIASKVYNGNATAGSLTLGTLSGFVGSETVTASGAAADYSSANVGTYNGVVVSYTLGNGSNGGLDSNYSLAAGSATGVITAKDVTIASGSVSGKVYDGNTGAVVTAGSLSGLVNGESLGTTMASGTFVSKDVGTRNVAATYTLTDGANLASNYNLINPTETLSATITAKVLTMTGSTATSKVYDGNTTASVTLGTLSGEVLGETLGFSTVVGTFNSKDVLAANTVTAVYTLTDGLNGELASNYSLANDSLASTITAKVLTISVATPSTVTSKVYDGSAAASVTVGALVGEVAGETLGATTAVGTFADKNIGTKNVAAVYTLVDGANGELVSNYSLAAETLTGTITAKDLSVFNAAVTTKVYDGNDAAVVTGAVLVGNSTLDNDGKFIGTETVTLSGGTTGTFASKNVGAGQTVTTTMNLGGSDAGNYTLNTQPTLSGTITAKALTMTGSSAASKVYDGNTTASVTLGTLSGEVVGETLGTSTVVGTFNSKDVLAANTVTAVYTLVDGANGELASNYSLANDSLASTITAKSLTMTGSTAATKVYDGNTTASVTLGTLSGEVGGETLGTSTAVGTFNSKDVLAANTVTAVYTLTDGLNGELASNYSLVNDGLASTITAKALTMTGSTAASKVYDGNTSASVTLGALSGEVAGETLGTSTVLGTFNSKDVLGANTVTAAYTLVDGANGELASNYSLANDSLASTITAKSLTMTGSTAATKVYDGNTTASVTLGTLSGEVAGETLGTPTVAGTFNSKDVLSANTVTAAYTLVDGANGELASNYSLANDSLASTITAKALTMTGSIAGTKVYDGNTTAVVTLGALSGEVSGETLGTPTVVGAFNSKDVLSANTVTAAYTLTDGANGELASNYSLANDSLASTITAKALTMTGSTAGSKVYDGNTTASVTLGALSGEVVGETLGASTVVGTFNSKDVLAANTVTAVYTLVDGANGELASNYSLANASLASTITAKSLTMTGSTAVSKVYDGNRTASVTLGALSGEVVGETLGTSTVVGTFNSKDVVGANTVTAAYTLVDGANGELASNYSLANDSLASTITAKSLTMTGSTAATKVYDGNRTASVTLGALSGEVAGETLGTSTVVGTFNSKDVLAANTVTAVYTLVDGANGELASNYSLASDNLASTITAKGLSITAPSIGSKTYDGLTTAGSLTLGTLSGFVGSETVTASGAAADYSSANVGSYNSAVTYNLADGLNGGLASNYSLAAGSATGVITAKTLTISVATPSAVASKVYNGTRDAAVTVGALDGEVAGETLGATTAVGTFADKNIGTKNVTAVYTLVNGLNGELASNYTLAAETLTGTITAKDLSVFSAAVTTKVYDGNDAAVVTGAVLVGNSTSDIDGKFIGTEAVILNGGTAGAFASKNVGAGQGVTTTMTLGGADAGNYTLNTQPTLSGTITAKALTMTGSSAASKVYDGNRSASVILGTLSGEVAGEALGASTVVGTFNSKDVLSANTVTAVYTLVDGANGELASNYSLANDSLASTITAKSLMISAPSIGSKTYDGLATAGSLTLGTLSGFVGSETVTASGAAADYSSANVGTYNGVAVSYTLGNGSNGGLALNYSLAAGSATGVITAKGLSITAPSISSKVYDGNAMAGSLTLGTLSGFVGSETVTASGAAVDYSSANVGTYNGVAVSYTLGNGSNGGLASNYSLAAGSATGVITAKGLSITAASLASKVYDGNRTAGTVTLGALSGFVGSELVTASGAAADYSSANVGSYSSAIAYTLSNGSNGGLASNYSLAAGSATGVITAKGLSITAPSIASKVYNGNATAGSLTLGTLSGFVGSETVTASGAAVDYSSANVGTYNGVAVSYTLSNGSNGGLASNYSLATGSATGVITAKDVTIASGSVSGKVYDGNTGAVVTAGGLTGLVVGENLGTTTAVGTFASKDVGTRNVTTVYTLTDGANLASNYNLLNPSEILSATITAKGLSVTAPSIASKKYDGTTTAGVVTVGTLSGFVGSEIVTAAGSAANYSSANVGSYSSAVTYTLSNGSNGGLASNYSLAAGSETGVITAKDLVVNAAGITVGKVYDGGTSINPATQVAIGLGALTGNSTGANDGKYIGTEAVTLAVDTAGVFERNLPGTMIPISTTVKLASGYAVNNNYSLRAQPNGLTGEITGTANLNQNGVGISVSSADYIHIRNTTASRMQNGLSISSATGSVLLENSSFDGWMQRSTPNQTISDGGATTFTFTESAATAVNSPVLRIKMEANDPANVNMNKQFMLLGDYQVLLRRDPNGVPGSGNEVATTLFSFPGSANDPNGFGSMAPSADLVIRDSATTQVKDLPWNTKEYSSLNGSGAAVDSGNYAAVKGEFKGDNAASALDINTASGGAVGKWDVTVSDPILGGEGKVTDVRLKYNNNTKALIQGPNGVRLVNVIFEGMDEVQVGAGLNDKVLMSGTLVSDPNIGKMVVKAGQTLEAQFASDATMKEVKTSAGNAEILAGVVKDSASPTGYSFISGPNRVLEMQTATISGQLSLASHTIVFNNANITSGGVIDARTRDGMVNRTYGSVVPGTVSFMGANGNTFLNTANSASMSIANSGNIVSALSGGQMRENGVGGATVMNVGRVR